MDTPGAGPAARDFHLLLPSQEGALMWGRRRRRVAPRVETDSQHKDADLPYLSGRAGVALSDGTVVTFGGMHVAQGVAAYGSDVPRATQGAIFQTADAETARRAAASRRSPRHPTTGQQYVRRVSTDRRRIPGAPRRRLAARARPAPPRTTTPPYD